MLEMQRDKVMLYAPACGAVGAHQARAVQGKHHGQVLAAPRRGSFGRYAAEGGVMATTGFNAFAAMPAAGVTACCSAMPHVVVTLGEAAGGTRPCRSLRAWPA